MGPSLWDNFHEYICFLQWMEKYPERKRIEKILGYLRLVGIEREEDLDKAIQRIRSEESK